MATEGISQDQDQDEYENKLFQAKGLQLAVVFAVGRQRQGFKDAGRKQLIGFARRAEPHDDSFRTEGFRENLHYVEQMIQSCFNHLLTQVRFFDQPSGEIFDGTHIRSEVERGSRVKADR